MFHFPLWCGNDLSSFFTIQQSDIIIWNAAKRKMMQTNPNNLRKINFEATVWVRPFHKSHNCKCFELQAKNLCISSKWLQYQNVLMFAPEFDKVLSALLEKWWQWFICEENLFFQRLWMKLVWLRCSGCWRSPMEYSWTSSNSLHSLTFFFQLGSYIPEMFTSSNSSDYKKKWNSGTKKIKSSLPLVGKTKLQLAINLSFRQESNYCVKDWKLIAKKKCASFTGEMIVRAVFYAKERISFTMKSCHILAYKWLYSASEC